MDNQTMYSSDEAIMKEIDNLYMELDSSKYFDGIRLNIVRLIKLFLKERKDKIDNWEKFRIVGAINSLSLNLDKGDVCSDVGLRSCLVDLQQCLVSKHKRDEDYTAQVKELNNVNYATLTEMINKVTHS